MAIAEVKAGDLFVGLEPAEAQLSVEWVVPTERASRLAISLLLVAVQLAWVAVLAYFAFGFLQL